MKEILRSRHFVVEFDRRDQLLRVNRSSVPFDSTDELRKEWTDVSAALTQAGRRDRSLLVDLRQAPARNDPATEAALRSVLPGLRLGFRRIGVCVRSAVGGLQVSRLARADGAVELISSNEEELLTYLKGSEPPQ